MIHLPKNSIVKSQCATYGAIAVELSPASLGFWVRVWPSSSSVDLEVSVKPSLHKLELHQGKIINDNFGKEDVILSSHLVTR